MSSVESREPLTFDIELNLLEDRLDPYYYKPEFFKLIRRIKSGRYEAKTIRHIRKSIEEGRITPKRSTYVEKGIPFIRAQNIAEDEIKLEGIKRIKREVHEEIEKSQARPDDVLLTIDGVKLGIATVVPANLGECTISNHMVRMRLKENVNSNYVSTFLNSNLGQMQIKRGISGSAIPGLRINFIEKILIPIPPKRIQNKTAEIMQDAYKERRAKLDKAEELLSNINDVVLEELRIELPDIEDKKIFGVEPEDLVDRLDSMYYHPKYMVTLKTLDKCPYKIKASGKIIEKIRYGASVKNIYVEKGVPFLRIQNLKENKIDLSEIEYLSADLKPQIGLCYVQEGDLLISRSGTIGLVAVVPKKADGFAFGSYMIKFKIKGRINPHYVSIFLNSALGKLQTERLTTGAVQTNITIPAIKSIKIPVPPPEIQNEIVKKVEQIYDEAVRLKQEAEKIVENTKQRVERIILKGEDIS